MGAERGGSGRVRAAAVVAALRYMPSHTGLPWHACRFHSRELRTISQILYLCYRSAWHCLDICTMCHEGKGLGTGTHVSTDVVPGAPAPAKPAAPSAWTCQRKVCGRACTCSVRRRLCVPCTRVVAWWRSVLGCANWRARAKDAGKTALAIELAGLLSYVPGWFTEQLTVAFYAPLSIAFVAGGSVGGSFRTSRQRCTTLALARGARAAR